MMRLDYPYLRVHYYGDDHLGLFISTEDRDSSFPFIVELASRSSGSSGRVDGCYFYAKQQHLPASDAEGACKMQERACPNVWLDLETTRELLPE